MLTLAAQAGWSLATSFSFERLRRFSTVSSCDGCHRRRTGGAPRAKGWPECASRRLVALSFAWKASPGGRGAARVETGPTVDPVAVSALPRCVDRSVGSTSRFGRACWPQGQLHWTHYSENVSKSPRRKIRPLRWRAVTPKRRSSRSAAKRPRLAPRVLRVRRGGPAGWARGAWWSRSGRVGRGRCAGCATRASVSSRCVGRSRSG